MEVVIPVLILACLAAATTVIYLRLRSTATVLPVTAEWIDELSVDRYRPMMRLLERDDVDFLRSQPGFTAGMASRMRSERCRIFRSYLGCLHSDFQRVSMALKIVMVQSRYDRPDLAAILVRSQRAFIFSMMLVYGRVLLYRLGLGTVEVAELLRLFDSARLELRSLVPAQMGAAA